MLLSLTLLESEQFYELFISRCFESVWWRGHWAGGHGHHAEAKLLVHADVDQRVVEGRALWSKALSWRYVQDCCPGGWRCTLQHWHMAHSRPLITSMRVTLRSALWVVLGEKGQDKLFEQMPQNYVYIQVTNPPSDCGNYDSCPSGAKQEVGWRYYRACIRMWSCR